MVMRFIPNTADNRFPVTLMTKMKVVKMMAKQRKYTQSLTIIQTSTIASLHYFEETVGHSLCQILMSMRPNDDPDTSLFVSVEEREWSNGYTVVFTVKDKRVREAEEIIPVLCIILEAKFGPQIWCWFTDEAKDSTQGFQWDEENKRVRTLNDEEDSDSDDNLSLESSKEFENDLMEFHDISGTITPGFAVDISFMLDHTQVPKNQYGDSGSVKTFRSTTPNSSKTLSLQQT